MKYQLWSQDEYGTGSIVGTFIDPLEAIKKASTLVTEANLGNSLSSSEQMKNLEAYMIEFSDQKLVYASNRPDGKHRAFKIGSTETQVVDPKNTEVQIYIGSKFDKQPDESRKETRLYMKDPKGNPVTTINNQILTGKTVYFLRAIS